MIKKREEGKMIVSGFSILLQSRYILLRTSTAFNKAVLAKISCVLQLEPV